MRLVLDTWGASLPPRSHLTRLRLEWKGPCPFTRMVPGQAIFPEHVWQIGHIRSQSADSRLEGFASGPNSGDSSTQHGLPGARHQQARRSN